MHVAHLNHTGQRDVEKFVAETGAHVVPETHTAWGEYSIVLAELNVFDYCQKNFVATHFVLVSQDTIPTVSPMDLEVIVTTQAKNMSLLDFCEWAEYEDTPYDLLLKHFGVNTTVMAAQFVIMFRNHYAKISPIVRRITNHAEETQSPCMTTKGIFKPPCAPDEFLLQSVFYFHFPYDWLPSKCIVDDIRNRRAVEHSKSYIRNTLPKIILQSKQSAQCPDPEQNFGCAYSYGARKFRRADVAELLHVLKQNSVNSE